METEQFADAAALDVARIADQCRLLTSLDGAIVNLADHDPTEEVGVIQCGDLQLQGLFHIANRRRNMAQDGIKERPHVFAVCGHIRLGEAAQTTTEEIGEVALIIIGTELDEQVQHLADSHLRVCAGTIDLVDKNDRAQTLLKSLLEHETGLGHRPLIGIDDQQAAINHAQDALHLTAEVRVTRGVNDIDARVLVVDRRVLGEDGDAALTLQIVGVQHTGGHSLTVAEDAGLLQQGIHQGGFAVVDVSDDRNVANRGARGRGAHWVKNPGDGRPAPL